MEISIGMTRKAIRSLIRELEENLMEEGRTVDVTIYGKNNNAMTEEVTVQFTNDDMDDERDETDPIIVDVM